jgi:uncharacterized protein YutE (UPF0331/DUF86 family)
VSGWAFRKARATSSPLLAAGGWIDPELAERLRRMVGFRNIAVRDYQALLLPIVASIITERLGDLLEFSAALLVRED